MKKTIILYGVCMAVLVSILKFIEYRFLVRDFSLEFYVGCIAVLCTGIGIWAGLKLTRKKTVIVPALPVTEFRVNQSQLEKTGISKREFEILELIAQGFSNQEIADKLFVSLNTIKTHTSNLFFKLDAKRRTQAVIRAKELGLIP